jgi:hypothetical protein
MKNSRSLAGPLVLLALFLAAASAGFAADTDGWVSLFDGKTLNGWKASEHPASFKVTDGVIVADGERAHLFYVGNEATPADFEDFEFSAEVMAKPNANSGIFILTAWQDANWPSVGFEVQVNNSTKHLHNYLEYKKTGSLYGVRNIYKPMARDNEWFTMRVLVQKPRVQIWVNDVQTVDYTEPALPLPSTAPKLNRIDHGTFALQAHDPGSVVHFRNIRVKRLVRAPQDATALPKFDDRAGHVLALARDNFPLVDLHTHLKGGLTYDQATTLSRRTGWGLGIATNGGVGFPIQNDSAALAFLETMQGKPVFLALQAEGREWVKMFSKETRAKFDYIFTDSMTWTNAAGKRLRLWIPEESDIGPDAEAFMEEFVAQTVKIIESEPIDIYVNPTYLPASIASRYDELWTEERMQRVIAAAAKHGVAIEINTRFKLPSEKFVKLAKAAGVKFTVGTNNAGADDFGNWDYALDLQKKASLTWRNMWVPGHNPSRAQRELR